MKSGHKLWICSENGKKVFGQGPCRLLQGVEKSGSLRCAAQNMDMAYSKAFSVIKNAEKELGYKLLIREIGGANGGGSSVTPEGKELIERYEEFREKAGLEIERIYLETFSNQW